MRAAQCGCRDDLEIRALTASFTEAANSGDHAGAAALFAEDGVWLLPGLGEVVGRTQITERLEQVLTGFEFLVQVLYQGSVVIEEDQARARWYLGEQARDTRGRTWATTAVYDDCLSRTDGWAFTSRRLTFLTRARASEDTRAYPFPIR